MFPRICLPINTCLYLIIFFELLLRLYDLAGASVVERDGTTTYALMGESFAKGGFKEALSGEFPPLYPLIIGFSHLFVPDVERAGRLVSLVFGILLIYLFYKGQLKGNGRAIGLSGFFLALTYPTRPEYVIFYVSLALILLKQKRFRHTIASVLSFLALAFLYLLCMRVETGQARCFPAFTGSMGC